MNHQLTPSETFTTPSPDGIGVPLTPQSPFDGLELPSETAAKLVASVINHYQGVDAGEVSLGSEPGANPIAEPQPPINPGDALSPELSWREQIAATWGSVAEKFSPRKRVGVAIAALALVSAACGGSEPGETSTAGDASSNEAVAKAEAGAKPRGVNILNIAESQPAKGSLEQILAAILENNQLAINTGDVEALNNSYVNGINNSSITELRALVEKGIADRERVGFNTWGVNNLSNEITVLRSDFDASAPGQTSAVVVFAHPGETEVFRNDAYTRSRDVGYYIVLLVTADGKPANADSSWLIDTGIQTSELEARGLAASSDSLDLARLTHLRSAQAAASTD